METVESIGEVISKNKEVFKKMVQCGLVSCSLATHYQMYQYFKKLNPSLSKMDRYQLTAENFKVDIRTTTRAIKKMER